MEPMNQDTAPQTPDSQTSPPGAPPSQAQMQGGGGEEGSSEQQASPQEQALYDMVVARAFKFMYGNGKDRVLQMLSSGEKPSQGIGKAAAMIVRSIELSARQDGQNFDEDILYNAGVEIVEDLAKFGMAAGAFKFDNPQEMQQQTEEGLFYAMRDYSDMLDPGEADPQEAQQIIQQNVQREQQQNLSQSVHQALQPAQPPGPPGMINKAMGGAR